VSTETAPLPGLDKFQQRAFNNLTSRHEERVLAAATEIGEYAGYVVRDLKAGRLGSSHASRILADAQELVTRLAILEEGINQVAGILKSAEGETS
jgi:hypothetical protein